MQQRSTPLQVQAHVHTRSLRGTPLSATKEKLLWDDAHSWMTALRQAARDEHIPGRFGLYAPDDAPEAVDPDLLIGIHYSLQPKVAEDLRNIAKHQQFRVLLLLSYVEPPQRQDWHKNLSHAFVSSTKDGELLLPDPADVRDMETRVRCHGMNFFNRENMRQLLQLAARERPR